MMPGMNGCEVCQRLKANPDTARVAVLSLTGKGKFDGESDAVGESLPNRVHERLAGLDSEAVEFLTKPIRRQELLDQVSALLRASGFHDK